MEELGFLMIHSGLTKAYGLATVCMWKPKWDTLSAIEGAAIKFAGADLSIRAVGNTITFGTIRDTSN
jgi:hypothetical protein